MKFSDYMEKARRTDLPKSKYSSIASGLNASKARLLHAAIGISTESGEVLDLLKKAAFHDEPIPESRLKEELGDLLWYIAIMLDAAKLDLASVLTSNIQKLKERHGDDGDWFFKLSPTKYPEPFGDQ